ncbi:cytochrome c oxidase assembly protein, partial [Tranquillimonas alkanivorans]
MKFSGEQTRGSAGGRTCSANPPAFASAIAGGLAFASLAFFTGTPLRAHTDGQPLQPHDFWTTWSLQPSVVVPLAVAAAFYAAGVHHAWRKAGWGRGVRTRQAVSFFGGMLALVAALVWPLDALGESLFAAHMGQHIVLMGLAAPLLVLGHPLPTMIRAMPRRWQRAMASLAASVTWRRGWKFFAATSVATTLQLVALLFWHAPQAIALSLENEVVHSVMHGSLFACGLLFWTAVECVRGSGIGRALLALLVMFKFSLILGALLAFAPISFYSSYGERAEVWGLSLLEDQQLAGLLMMSVGSMMYVVAAVIVIAAWL